MLILRHSHFLKGSLEGKQTYLIKHKDKFQKKFTFHQIEC